MVAAVSVLGIFLLLPLYLSQRRDVQRLREWMQGEPRSPREDLALSERILDSAERDLAKAYADRGEPVPGTMEFEAVKAATAVKEPGKVEPAASRIGGEPPHQRASRARPGDDGALGARAAPALEAVRRPGHPAALACRDRASSRWPSAWPGSSSSTACCATAATTAAPRVTEPGGIEVAVLNTTTASGIAGRVATQIEDAGFVRGQVGNIERETDQTIVMYAPDQKRAANRVAKELGDVAVQQIDREVQAAAGGADVVVILGQDRVAP